MTAALLEIDGNLWSVVVQNALIFTQECASRSSMRSIDSLQLHFSSEQRRNRTPQPGEILCLQSNSAMCVFEKPLTQAKT